MCFEIPLMILVHASSLLAWLPIGIAFVQYSDTSFNTVYSHKQDLRIIGTTILLPDLFCDTACAISLWTRSDAKVSELTNIKIISAFVSLSWVIVSHLSPPVKFCFDQKVKDLARCNAVNLAVNSVRYDVS